MSEKVCWDNCDGTSWESPQKKWIPDESSKLIAKRRKIDKKNENCLKNEQINEFLKYHHLFHQKQHKK